MAQADWDEVTYIRKKQPKSSQLRSQQVIVYHLLCLDFIRIEEERKMPCSQNFLIVDILLYNYDKI